MLFIKKILILLFIFVFILSFASCQNFNFSDITGTESKAVSETISDTVSNVVSDTASDNTSNVTSEGTSFTAEIIGNVFYGEGFCLYIPDGFILTDNTAGTAVFNDSAASQLIISTRENTKQIYTLTKEQIEAELSSRGNIKINNYEELSFDGQNGISYEYTTEVASVKIISYYVTIINEDNIIDISLTTANDLSKIFSDMLSTVEIY